MSEDLSRLLHLVMRLDESVRAQGDQIFALADEQRSVRDTLRQMQAELGNHGEELKGQRQELQWQREELKGHREELKGQREELKLLGDRMINLRTDLMGRMDRLQDSITSMRDDIGVNMGATAHAVETNDNTRAELRSLGDVVTAMSRQIQRLQADVRALKGEP